MVESYDFRSVERTWQERWERERTYAIADDDPREKYYVLEMLPYPSGDLHVGHAKNYTLGDAIARMMRMLDYAVLHPMGWDAFGLPAENAAIARGIDPENWTRENIANMQRQVRLMGVGYDWAREITTCEPEYYRWNQWLFLRLYEAGLAYKRHAPVNWCPKDATVLANEQVIDGRCWRCGTAVERRNLSQWFLKITAYADRLLADLEQLGGWPERTRTMQRNWIGRSEGVRFAFALEGAPQTPLEVFTTRVDTVYGTTFLAIAAEHPLIEAIARLAGAQRAAEIAAFADSLKSKSELERTSLMVKDGRFTGVYAIHPLSHERVPIWVTNYVLAEYGTGAVMGVPAHDERDFAFAHAHGLPVVQVIVPPGQPPKEHLDEAYTEDGRTIDSGDFSGMSSAHARRAIAERLEAMKLGRAEITYRLRDWLVSRQRYWGTPIPIVTCAACGEVPLPDSALPVLLPSNVQISGEGAPLASVPAFVTTSCPRCGGPAHRETDTMDTFFESSWYYLRYLDPCNAAAPWSAQAAAHWMNVDQYIGGSEHAVLHLLYSRFFYKFFGDQGWVSGRNEPFERLFHQGMVLYHGEKMSKSRGNVVGIDETVEQQGVDAMRLFLLYVTPPEDTSEWSEDGISGRVRFINRVWRTCEPLLANAATISPRELPACADAAEKALLRAVHVALKSACDETRSQRFHYNATIAKFDEYLNALSPLAQTRPQSPAVRYAVHVLPLAIAPFAPHLAEELWARLGHSDSVHLQAYPQPEAYALALEQITVVVQINGKIRARITTTPGITEEAAYALALGDPAVHAQLDGKTLRKRIYVADRLLNLVVG
ncbi:MAG: leucine--tRNA ligase [Vulcanimicrobiaceae bacterium]